jgi:hypothetical protein
MSWSASFPNGVRAASLDEDLEPANASASPPMDGWEPHVRDQFEAASDSARALIDSGAVGDSGKTFNVNLSGHANPGHLPASGWANDMVSVSVSQR